MSAKSQPLIEVWFTDAVEPTVVARLDSREDTKAFLESLKAQARVRRYVLKNSDDSVLVTWNRD